MESTLGTVKHDKNETQLTVIYCTRDVVIAWNLIEMSNYSDNRKQVFSVKRNKSSKQYKATVKNNTNNCDNFRLSAMSSVYEYIVNCETVSSRKMESPLQSFKEQCT